MLRMACPFNVSEEFTKSGAGDDILAGNCMAIVGSIVTSTGIQTPTHRLTSNPLDRELQWHETSLQLRGEFLSH